MHLITVLILCFTGSSNGLVNNENLIAMHPQTVKDFATAFNRSLAIIVSTAYKNAVEIANELEQLNAECKSAVQAANGRCSQCVQNVCGKLVQIPPFSLVDPFVCTASIGLANPDMCPALVLGFTTEVITRVLGDVVNILGDEASVFLNNVHDALDIAGDAVREGISSSLDILAEGIDHVVNGIGDIGGDLIDGIGDIGGDLIDGIGDIGGDLIDGIGDIGGNLVDGIGDIGDNLVDGIGDIGNVISHTRISIPTPRFPSVRVGRWGKKRRKRTTDDTRACMEICDPCDTFLLDTPEETAIAVCGLELINRNKAFKRMTERISNVVSGIFNTTHPIISEILYDPESMNNLFQLTYVVMAVRMNGGIEYYRTEVPFSTMNIAETAVLMAAEYWGKTKEN